MPVRIHGLATALFAAMHAGTVAAQTSQAAGGTDPDDATIQEIVVTAQKRTELLRDVPISIAVFSEGDLVVRGADELKDLANVIPNVIVGIDDTNRNTAIAMRGIYSLARNVGQETGVGVYLDGVYTGRSETYNQRLPDIERVEVLRGPQGTLFGKNTIAGAISLSTVKPGPDMAAKASLEMGNYGLVRADGYLSGPLVEERLFGKVSVYGAQSDGYGYNPIDGGKTGDVDHYGARIQLRSPVTDKLELGFSADYFESERSPYSGDIGEGYPGYVPGEYTTYDYPSPFEQVEYGGIALTADYSMDNDYQLSSITSWRTSDRFHILDNAQTGPDLFGPDIFHTEYSHESEYASQEFRLVSPVGRSFDYVAGLYFMYQRSQAYTPFVIGQDFPIPPLRDYVFLTTPDVKTYSYAAYFNGSYHFDESLTLNVGARYTYDSKDMYFMQQGVPGFIADIPPLTRDSSEDDVSPTISLTYAYNDTGNVYARITRGFKSGGFNVDNISSTDRLAFGPEYVTNYELGLKAASRGGRFGANLAVFHMDYEDLQVTQFDAASSSNFISNAASATIRGLELEMSARLAPGFDLTAGLGLLDTEFDEYIDAFGNDLAGNELVLAPKVTFNMAAQYTVPVSAGLQAMLRGEYSYRDETQSDVENDPETVLDAYGIYNARLGIESRDGRWGVYLWGKNLADERYLTGHTLSSKLVFMYPEEYLVYAQPRTYGAQFSVRY